MAAAMFLAACVVRSTLPLDAGPGQEEGKKFGDMPVVTAKDGSILPDPNALGIGPEGVTERDLSPQEELRELIAGLPEDRKLVLADGQVVGIAGTCSFPHDYDPSNKCMGLHDLSTLDVITVDERGEIDPQWNDSGKRSPRLEELLADPQVREQIITFIANAPAD